MKFLGLACCLSTALAWSIKNGKIQLRDQAAVRDTIAFSEGRPILVVKGKQLDFSFEIADIKQTDNEDGSVTVVAPQQVSLVLTNSAGFELVQQFKVRKNKAKISVPYHAMPGSSELDPLFGEILLSGTGDAPIRERVVSIVVARPQNEKVSNPEGKKTLFHGGKPLEFEPLPEIIHKFSPPHKTVPAFFALVCSASVVMLLATLFGGWAKYASTSVGGIVVVGLVACMEGVFLLYYLGLSIFGAITYASILAPVIYLALRRQLRTEAVSAVAVEAEKLKE